MSGSFIGDMGSLNELMNRLEIKNADLVRASTEQLTFKMVQKGRKGRTLTANVQRKILNALMRLCPELKIGPGELFPQIPRQADDNPNSADPERPKIF